MPTGCFHAPYNSPGTRNLGDSLGSCQFCDLKPPHEIYPSIDLLLQCEHGYCSSHLYFLVLHRSQAWAARGRLVRLGAGSSTGEFWMGCIIETSCHSGRKIWGWIKLVAGDRWITSSNSDFPGIPRAGTRDGGAAGKRTWGNQSKDSPAISKLT